MVTARAISLADGAQTSQIPWVVMISGLDFF